MRLHLRIRQALLLVALCCTTSMTMALERDKTDVITLQNGDRITGEIIELEYGILQVKTSNMGTLRIEWPAIQAIASQYSFFIERLGGRRYYGKLTTAESGRDLEITDSGRTESIPVNTVMRLSQIESGFWRALDGSFSLGYNFTKSSDISISSIAFDANYRGEKIESTLNVSMLTTKSPERGTADRDQITSYVRFRRPHETFWLLLTSLERNEELGIEGRVQAGGAIGRHFMQSTTSELTGFVGASFNGEWATGTEGAQQSVEAVLGTQWRVFRFSDPETSLSSSFLVYPSITESGRYRGELNSTLSRELVNDLTLDLTFYGSYDNRPPDVNVEKDDYGIVTSLGYKF